MTPDYARDPGFEMKSPAAPDPGFGLKAGDRLTDDPSFKASLPHEVFRQLPSSVKAAYVNHMALLPNVPVYPNQIIYPGEEKTTIPEEEWYNKWLDWFSDKFSDALEVYSSGKYPRKYR